MASSSTKPEEKKEMTFSVCKIVVLKLNQSLINKYGL